MNIIQKILEGEIDNKNLVKIGISSIIFMISYFICTISLFFTNKFLVPIFSFIVLFLSVYFISLSIYNIKIFKKIIFILSLFILETLIFCIFLGFSRYLLIELFLFHAALLVLFIMLHNYLNKRTGFLAFSYFTGGGFFVTTLFTIFFCVFMVGKYREIPFTCDDLTSFPNKLVEDTINPVKSRWNDILSFFTIENTTTNSNIPEFYSLGNSLSDSSSKASSDEIESFFTGIRNNITSDALDVTGKISKATCEYRIQILQNIQNSGGIQITAIVIGYFLLVGVFKILLWIINILGLVLFIILRLCRVYKFEKKVVEKKFII